MLRIYDLRAPFTAPVSSSPTREDAAKVFCACFAMSGTTFTTGITSPERRVKRKYRSTCQMKHLDESVPIPMSMRTGDLVDK